MDVKISVKETLEPACRRQLNDLSELFPVEGRPFTWVEPTHHIVACINGELVGHLGFGRHLIKVQTHLLPVIGVGGVVVRPDFQGKNIPEKLFSRLHSTAQLNACGHVSTLFCPHRLTGYYQKHGYTLFPKPVPFMQQEKLVTSSFCFMWRGELPAGDITLTTAPW